MNPPDTEETAPHTSPASSTGSSWEYLNEPVTSNSEDDGDWESDGNASPEPQVQEEEEESSSGGTTPDLEVGDCSQRSPGSGSEHMDENSQSNAGTASPDPQVDESKESPDVTPMDHEESNSQSIEIVEEEMILSPLHPSTDLDTIQEEDELDSSMLKLFSDIVRCLVTRILHIAIREHNEYLCYGCKISHGSQKQHTCLFGIPNNFLRKHYDALEKKVLTERFLVAGLVLRNFWRNMTSMSLSKRSEMLQNLLYYG